MIFEAIHSLTNYSHMQSNGLVFILVSVVGGQMRWFQLVVLEIVVRRVLPAIKLKPTLGIGLTECDIAFVDTGSLCYFFFLLAAQIRALSFFI